MVKGTVGTLKRQDIVQWRSHQRRQREQNLRLPESELLSEPGAHIKQESALWTKLWRWAPVNTKEKLEITRCSGTGTS